MNKIIAPILMLTSSLSIASVDQTRVVYGDDNRVETYQATKRNQTLANSTAGMIENVKLIQVGKNVMLPPASIQSDMGLCADERFSDQPSSVICSGFLVGPDLLVTAGHCVTNEQRCKQVSFIFDYKIKSDTKKADMLVSADNVYKCAKVIETKLDGYGKTSRDFALVKLDRPVKNRAPLKYRVKGKIKNKENILVIGHPSGLPQKVASGAQVYDNSPDGFFETNLDTFGGNSGSAVFNNKTGVVEGILVRGAKDYVSDQAAGCARVNHEDEDITGRTDLGEAVSRITDVPTLKYRSLFLAAAKSGDLDSLKKYAKEVKDINITDNEMNSALHLASAQRNIAIVKFLIESKADLNAQNLKGETALHIAAFNNMQKNISKLLVAGADVLIKDNYGVYPSERTSYFAFKIREMLRKTQTEEKKKRRNNR